MRITCWGARGSLPSPGAHTLRYGGHTACVSVEVDGRLLILDAGSGIRKLGQHIAGDGRDVVLLHSHMHLDHTCGFPFFEPLFEQGRRIFLGDGDAGNFGTSLLDLLDGIRFPMRADELPSVVMNGTAGLNALREVGLEVDRMPVNHGEGTSGFRVRHAARSMVYIPDNELGATPDAATFRPFVDFCAGADVLFHDAQYTEAEMPLRDGWGHSTVERAIELAVAAHVDQLILFHHDPDRTDGELDAIAEAARHRLMPHGIDCTAAYEGLVLDLST